MGMLRTLIVLGAGFALLPSPPPADTPPGAEPQAGAISYVAAAAETMADMRSFCQRNPNLCATAGSLANSVEGKAKYSAKLIYEWANGKPVDVRTVDLPEDLASAAETTASIRGALHEDDPQNTLTLADLEPEWQAPVRRKPKG
jgi:Family of unknown function (DUF5330)